MIEYDDLRRTLRTMLEAEEALQPESRTFDADRLQEFRRTLENADARTILYVLTDEDAQGVAEDKGMGGKLTEDEFYTVKKGVESGIGACWYEVMECALEGVEDDRKKAAK